MARSPQDVYHSTHIWARLDDPVAFKLLVYESKNTQIAYRGAVSKKLLTELASKYPGLQTNAENIKGYVVSAGPTTAEVDLMIAETIVLKLTCYVVLPTELSDYELALFTETRHPPQLISADQLLESARAGQMLESIRATQTPQEKTGS